MFKRPRRLPNSLFLRPEKTIEKRKPLDRAAHRLVGKVLPPLFARPAYFRRFVRSIHRHSEALAKMPEAALTEEVALTRRALLKQGFTDALLIRTFALIREVAGRTLGMYHFDSQLLGGLALFHGTVAEMQTGEGKTLTATLPAAAAALGGVPVHVITVNEYLAERDAELMAPVYHTLGLSLGCIKSDMTSARRQAIYACDVVYCTNKDLVFDYLKDQLVLKQNRHPLHLFSARLRDCGCGGNPGNNNAESGLQGAAGRLMLRGLHFAIVDEADSVLLDEARTPLIISGESSVNTQEFDVYRQAMEIAAKLNEKEHYQLSIQHRKVSLTEEGEAVVRTRSAALGAYWKGRVRRKELIEKALTALLLFDRDKHYVIQDNKVTIVDEHTGRIMADRTWEQGLHQLIEIKEGCELTKPRNTLVRISYQRFFRLYHHLGGMTGTAKEVVGELWSVYGLAVTRIPTHKPSRRIQFGHRVCRNSEEKWQAVVERITAMRAVKRSVLVGTASVGLSEYLSARLTRLGIGHQLLNAKQDHNEADIIAQAGGPGQITIATNMAGRGTDIKLSAPVKEAGGLHVILTEFHDASRIDRQLEGRCARQGDPGSFEIIVSLEDSLLIQHGSGWKNKILKHYFTGLMENARIRNVVGLYMLRSTQRKLEKKHVEHRHWLLKSDENQAELLAFSGSRI